MYGLSIVIIIIIINVMLFYTYQNTVYVKSSLNGKYYLVQNINQKEIASNILAEINNRIDKIITYFQNNINTEKSYYKYIIRLITRVKNMIIMENSSNIGTSYSVNKGDRMVLCIRSKKNPTKFHDLNTITYVALHELSHIACPEYGHTKLFHKIFRFLLRIAIKINIYKAENYELHPVEYCGLKMNVYIPAEIVT